MKMIVLFLILFSLNSLAEFYNLRMIKKDGTVLYSNDGGKTWKNYKEVTEKYYTEFNEISISKSFDSDANSVKMYDYNGNKFNPDLVNITSTEILIKLPKKNIYVVQINFDKIHYTFVINNK